VTALCGLAFLGGGHVPDRGPYGKLVRKDDRLRARALEENGFISDSGTNMYSHAFATLFLAQVHGMTKETRIRAGLERAARLIVDCQNKQGGWRYYAFTPEADLSVTVCQLQALRAAYNIGIQVDKNVMERAVEYVKRAAPRAAPTPGCSPTRSRAADAYRKNREYAINAAAVTSCSRPASYDESLSGPALSFVEDSYREIRDYYPDHYYSGTAATTRCSFSTMRAATSTSASRPAVRRPARDAGPRTATGRTASAPATTSRTAIACLILELALAAAGRSSQR
jgi:hypothetical protein